MVPGSEPPVIVEVGGSASWEALERALPGAATATTTTILAALWPDKHFVFDWRVAAAANGLRVHAGASPTHDIDPDGTTNREITIADYALVRDWLLPPPRRPDGPWSTSSERSTSSRNR